MTVTTTATTTNRRLLGWVDEMAALCTPDRVEWCDGSQEEFDRLCRLMVEQGTLTPLDEAKRPGSYWATSDPGAELAVGRGGVRGRVRGAQGSSCPR